MKAISIHDAKTNLSKYIEAAKQGEAIQIGRFGRPEVALTALQPKTIKSQRRFGIAKGKITAKSDAFTPATDKIIARLLSGES